MSGATRSAGRALFLVALVVFALLPFQWMLVASLKPGDEQLIRGNPWWVEAPYWTNYLSLANPAGPFGHWLINTVLVMAATLGISLVATPDFASAL